MRQHITILLALIAAVSAFPAMFAPKFFARDASAAVQKSLRDPVCEPGESHCVAGLFGTDQSMRRISCDANGTWQITEEEGCTEVEVEVLRELKELRRP